MAAAVAGPKAASLAPLRAGRCGAVRGGGAGRPRRGGTMELGARRRRRRRNRGPVSAGCGQRSLALTPVLLGCRPGGCPAGRGGRGPGPATLRPSELAALPGRSAGPTAAAPPPAPALQPGASSPPAPAPAWTSRRRRAARRRSRHCRPLAHGLQPRHCPVRAARLPGRRPPSGPQVAPGPRPAPHGRARGCPASGSLEFLWAARALAASGPVLAYPPPGSGPLPSVSPSTPDAPSSGAAGSRGPGLGSQAGLRVPEGVGSPREAGRGDGVRAGTTWPGCVLSGMLSRRGRWGRGARLSRLLRAGASASGKPLPLRVRCLRAMAISSCSSLPARDGSLVESTVLNY